MALHYLQAGCDFYGRPTTAIWFHIPQAHRRRIMPLLLGNTFGQFANQATRCVYNTFDAQYSYPGSLWTRSSCTTLPPPLPLPLPLPRPLPLPLPLTRRTSCVSSQPAAVSRAKKASTLGLGFGW